MSLTSPADVIVAAAVTSSPADVILAAAAVTSSRADVIVAAAAVTSSPADVTSVVAVQGGVDDGFGGGVVFNSAVVSG